MPKIIHNGVEYGGGGYSKKQIDDKLRLKLDKSSVDSVLSSDSVKPVQNKVVTKALIDKVSQVKVMPTSDSDGVAVLYTGNSTADYKQGHVYQYNETDGLWIDITDVLDVIKNVESLPTANIEDMFYRVGGGVWANKTITLSLNADDVKEQLCAIGYLVVTDTNTASGRDITFNSLGNQGYQKGETLYHVTSIQATWSDDKYVMIANAIEGHVTIATMATEDVENTNFRTLEQNELWAGDSETQTIRRVAWNDEVTIQYEIMPTPSENEFGKIVQYVGATNASYTNGYFYKCVSDGGVTPAYSWEKLQVSDGGDSTPHWSGTRAEYEAIKDTLEAGTYVSITDDYDDGLEVVDVIENGNMNAVTSNAVAKITSRDLSTLTWNTTYVDLGTWATGGILERCGIVQFTKIFSVKAGIPSGTIICSGLPKPAMAAEIPVAWDGDSAMGGFFLNTNGDLASWATVTANTNCRINLVYIKA